MAKTIANGPILYLGRMYQKGDALPCHDQKMVEAWLKAGTASAVVVSDLETTTEPEATADEDEMAMSREALEGMTVAELKTMAEQLGVDVSKVTLKADIITALCLGDR